MNELRNEHLVDECERFLLGGGIVTWEQWEEFSGEMRGALVAAGTRIQEGRASLAAVSLLRGIASEDLQAGRLLSEAMRKAEEVVQRRSK